MAPRPDPVHVRRRLSEARVMLIFSPELCAPRDPLEVLDAVLGSVDAVQVRPKPPEASRSRAAPCAARDVLDWCVRVLDLLASRPQEDVLVIANDRVDVAALLWERGCAGVHVGQDDCPVGIARDRLGPGPLIGLSTHDARQVALAADLGVDYLGFGPVHATRTKGYERGLGAEACWIASAASPRPVFAIGGIDSVNAGDLSRVGRVAVGSAILTADDPARAARELRRSLEPG